MATDNGGSEDKEFNLFWSAYPKKRSKGEAFKAWRQVNGNRPPISKMLVTLSVLKASHDWQRDAGQYIPYPASWLRAWGWDDVPEVELSNVFNGKMWWESVSGVEAKAREMQFGEWNPNVDRTFQDYTERLKRLVNGNVIQLKSA